MPTLAEIQDQHRTVVENAEKTDKTIGILKEQLKNMRHQAALLQGAKLILEGFLNAPQEKESVPIPEREDTWGVIEPKDIPLEEREAASGNTSEAVKPRKGKA